MFDWFKRNTQEPAPAEGVTPGLAQEPVKKRGGGFIRNRIMSRMFAAANHDRTTTQWGGTPLSADEIILRNQVILVARSREQCANNDYGRSFLRQCRQNIVGPQGVTMQAQARTDSGKMDKGANEALENGWFDWGRREHCDVTGKRSWREIQKSCITSAAKDGEFIVRLVTGTDGGEYGLALQVIDPQRCPVDMNEDCDGSGTFIRQGIRFNKYGRPMGYLFRTLDEGEANYWSGGKSYVEVPAAEIVHGFLEDMVGQKRGLPWMATALYRMRQMAAMEQAAIVNARVGANKLGFIEWDEGSQGPEFDEDEGIEIESEPGEYTVLPQGARIKETSPQYPSNEYSPFVKQALRGMAAGFGVLYNNLASDLEGVNFSSIRQGTLDEREHWKDLQEWLIESLVQPVFNAWLPRALLLSKLTYRGRPLRAERIDRYRSAISWQARRWQWIDPRADVQSAVDSKNNMLTSPSTIIREQGKDPQTVWAETARDVAAMIEAFVSEGVDAATAKELVMLSMGRQPPKPAPTGQPANENAQV